MQAQVSTETQGSPLISTTCTSVLDELRHTLSALSEVQIHSAVQCILTARRVFFVGAGRSGLALEMAAMRVMHLGLTVYVVGEVVTPAIERGDLLVVASGSGTTASPVRAAWNAGQYDSHNPRRSEAQRSWRDFNPVRWCAFRADGSVADGHHVSRDVASARPIREGALEAARKP